MADNAPKTKPADKLRNRGLTLTIWPQATVVLVTAYVYVT